MASISSRYADVGAVVLASSERLLDPDDGAQPALARGESAGAYILRQSLVDLAAVAELIAWREAGAVGLGSGAKRPTTHSA